MACYGIILKLLVGTRQSSVMRNAYNTIITSSYSNAYTTVATII